MNYHALDIETVANESSSAYYDQNASDLAPKNLKDPDKIAAAIEAKKSKAGLTWWTGQVRSFCIQQPGYDACYYQHENENQVLCKLRDYLYEYNKLDDLCLIGKSIVDFDIPFLIGRYLKYDQGIPKPFMISGQIRDVDHMFSRSRACGQVSSLKNYAWGLGISGKMGSGDQVQAMVDELRFEELEAYNKQDVRIVLEMLRRYRESDKYTNEDGKSLQPLSVNGLF